MTAPESPVQDYLAGLAEPRRTRIAALYERARSLAPYAVEGTKYAMPALVVDGKGLIAIMSTAKHVGIYPFSGRVVSQVAGDLVALGIPTTKGAIQLPDDRDLPTAVFDRLIRARLAELNR